MKWTCYQHVREMKLRKSGGEAEAETAKAGARAGADGRRQSAEEFGQAIARPAAHMRDKSCLARPSGIEPLTATASRR